MVKDIIHNVHFIKEESKHVDSPESLHDKSYDLLLSIHHFFVKQDRESAERAVKVFNDIKGDVENRSAHGDHGSHNTDRSESGDHDAVILHNIESIGVVITFLQDYLETGIFDPGEGTDLLEYRNSMKEFIINVNTSHFEDIGDRVNDSYDHMSVILYLYFAFLLLGSLIAYAGYKLLKESTVNPIKKLAEATEKVAAGDLNISVSTRSRTEIGSLYRSFNQMTEKLHMNEKRLENFNRQLENKVRERTEALQMSNEELNKTQATLVRTEKAAAIGQIAAGVTHEIKNPLNSLSINTQILMRDLLKKHGDKSPDYESAAHIRYEVNRINNILEEFVKYAKFPEPKFYDNDLKDVMLEVVGLISESARQAGVSIETSLPENMPVFRFDARQLKEVFINLAQNAMVAMREGGTIGIRAVLQNDSITVTVQDSGKGIEEKNLEKIFIPFFSTKEGGMGLGLPICQRIIESHGGEIQCKSSQGEGTVFEITIPLV